MDPSYAHTFTDEEIEPIKGFLSSCLSAKIGSEVGFQHINKKGKPHVPAYDLVLKQLKVQDDPEMYHKLIVAMCSHAYTVVTRLVKVTLFYPPSFRVMSCVFTGLLFSRI